MSCPPADFWNVVGGGLSAFLFFAGIALVVWVAKKRKITPNTSDQTR
jgi:hypothetical protein